MTEREKKEICKGYADLIINKEQLTRELWKTEVGRCGLVLSPPVGVFGFRSCAGVRRGDSRSLMSRLS